MDLKQWCKIDEQIHIGESNEQYNQFAGFNYSEKVINHLAQMKMLNAEFFLGTFHGPREAVISALQAIGDSKVKKLELKLHSVRNKKISSSKYKFDKASVNWSTWRQFNSIEKDSSKRKYVFDEFITKTKYISPIVNDRFTKLKEIYAEYSSRINSNNKVKKKINPLDGYLENEKISYSRLIQFVKSLGQEAKKPFLDTLKIISKKVLGREAEYYDDFYFFRNRVYSNLENYFSGIDPIVEVKKVLRSMQFDLSKIQFDVENRKNKYPSPICFFIQVPNDIRILYKTESHYFDLQGCFHETGHAMHATSINPEIEYWNKYNISMGIAEIFSILLEKLTRNRDYLRLALGIKDEKILDEVIVRNTFMELFFATFYTVNSLMKAEFWHKNLSIDDASKSYSKLMKDYTGFEMPGEYWLLHHILPDEIMYVPSYLLAAVRASELDVYLTNKFGETWWKEEKAGQNIRDIVGPGSRIELTEFSRLDASIFLKEITSI